MRDVGPWFRRWPAASVAVAAALYAGVFALRMTTGAPSDTTSMFYALPIALLALTFGLAAGVAAGLAGTALVAIWAVANHVALSPVGWATRVVPLLLLGVLLGQAADRLRRSQAELARLDTSSHWHRQAAEINDSIVQGLAVAKWALESGDLDAALRIVSDTLDQAHAMVSQLLRDAGLEPGGEHAPRSLATLSSAPAPLQADRRR
jgi:glucose-6-phosphate-specific signal transduction histidine kinase